MITVTRFLKLACCFLVCAFAAQQALSDIPKDMPEGASLYAAWTKADHYFTPDVKAAYLNYVKAQTKQELEAAGVSFPKDFMAWVDSDPIVESTVYGVRQQPVNMLRMLRSLELDLGKDLVRKEYTHLALAMAVYYVHEGPKADLTERDPIKLVIPERNPLKPVDTKDPNRELDKNDHIINFLNDHPVEYKVKVPPKKEGEPATEETKTRQLRAADMFYSTDLQKQFNDYMAAKGHPTDIKCSRPRRQPDGYTHQAALLFRQAYLAKGVIANADKVPTHAESFLFWVRNDKFRFPEEVKRGWPRYPLKQGWPTLTLLVAWREPLRQAEDVWQRYVKNGSSYPVKYRGSLAQNTFMLGAASMAPFDFPYGSIQMKSKDGGVCGTQSSVQIRQQAILGIPGTTTSSSSHCGVANFRYNGVDDTYSFAQESANALPWVLGPRNVNRSHAIYFHSTAWAINYDLQSYLDTTLAYGFYSQLSKEDQKAYGMKIVESAYEMNPYSMLISQLAVKGTVMEQLHLYKKMQTRIKDMIKDKPGCPERLIGLGGTLGNTIVTQPIPTDKADALEVYEYIKSFAPPNPAALARYQTAIQGIDTVLNRVEEEIKAFAALPSKGRNSSTIRKNLDLAAKLITDTPTRVTWLRKMRKHLEGKMFYRIVNRRGPHYSASKRNYSRTAWSGAAGYDGLLILPYTLAGDTPPSRHELMEEFIDQDVAAMQELVKDPKANGGKIAEKLRHYSLQYRSVKHMGLARIWGKRLWDQVKPLAVENPSWNSYKNLLDGLTWSISDASINRHLAPGVITPDKNYYWYSYARAQTNYTPQHVSIDMHAVRELSSFTYTPRRQGKVSFWSGLVTGYAFYTSLDGTSWDLAAEGDFGFGPKNTADPTIAFAPRLARYFKFVATEVHESMKEPQSPITVWTGKVSCHGNLFHSNVTSGPMAAIQRICVGSSSLDQLGAYYALQTYRQTQALCDKQELAIEKVYPLAELYHSLEHEPMPTAKAEQDTLYEFIKASPKAPERLKLRCQVQCEGEAAVMTDVVKRVDKHLLSDRSHHACVALAKTINDSAHWISSPSAREKWLNTLESKYSGKESYLILGANSHIRVDEAAKTLYQLAEKTLPHNDTLCQPHLDRISLELNDELAKTNSLSAARAGYWNSVIHHTIQNLINLKLNDDAQIGHWKESLVKQLSPRPEFAPFLNGIRKKGWQVLNCTHQVKNYWGTRAIDTNLGTDWRTAMGTPEKRTPRSLVMDFLVPHSFESIEYLGSSAEATFANICRFYTSNDNKRWQLVADSTFDFSPEVISVEVPLQRARYLKLELLDILRSEEKDSGLASLRELDVL